jgi:diguanylate cyclase (GGDEF)-like protein
VLLVGNLVAVLFGDVVFGLQTADGTYVDGGVLDVVWLIAYMLFASAALHPSMAALFDARPISVTLLGPVRLVFLAAAMLVGPVLLALDQAQSAGFALVVAGATAVTSILVVVRLAGIVRRLALDLERGKVLEAQLSYQAYHDPLTGLANRRRFIEGLRDTVSSGTGAAVLFLDLDDFKDVNDTLGHEAGDALLTAVGHRILATIRPEDLGCRIGGDEFAIQLPGAGAEEAEGVAARLLGAVCEPVMIGSRQLVASASIGVTVAGAQDATEVDELLRRADVAMYQAKAEGKSRTAMYDRRLDRIPGTSPMQPEGRHTRTPRAARPRASAAPSR